MAHISLEPITPADLPTLSRMSQVGMLDDPNTQFKALDPIDPPPDGVKGMYAAYENWINRPKHAIDMVKAVDHDGNILGWAVWGLRGFEPESEKQESVQLGSAATPAPAPPASKSPQYHPEPEDPAASVRHRLEAYTTADLHAWMAHFMPPGTKCMYIISLSVHPDHQGKGVGSALMRRGTDRADKEGVFCWVHSSDLVSAVKAYERNGFVEVGRLEVDLDSWNEDGRVRVDTRGEKVGDGTWGVYVFRYMRREPLVGKGA